MSKIIPYLYNPISSEKYLKSAVETANWIDTLSVKCEKGKYWSRSPRLKDDEIADNAYYRLKGLYSGAAGVGEFYIRLYEITKDEKYLNEAKEAAEYLLSTNEKSTYYNRVIERPGEGLDAIKGFCVGIYTGPAGEGFFLDALYEYVKDERYIDFIKDVADDLIDNAVETDTGIKWTEETDVSSDGGFVLYFIRAYERTKDEKYIVAARKAADRIAATGKPAKNGGTYYIGLKFSDDIPFPKGSFFPNFAHGVSGIGYIFAALYKATNDEKYLELAKGIALYIEGIAIGDDEAKLVPYLDNEVSGPIPDMYYLSTCHGPAGSSIVFKLLYEITGDKHYLDWIIKFAKGTVKAGALDQYSWGYWASNSLCCGVPGVVEYMTEVYKLTGEEEYLQYAKRAANKLVSDAFNVGDGLNRWVNAWTRSTQDDVDTYIGLYMGAAGCAAALLGVYGAEKKISVRPVFEYLF